MTDTQSTEPVKITTAIAGAEVVIRPFANARLRKATRNVFLKYASIDPKNMQGKSKEQIEKMDVGDMTKFEKIPAEVISEIKEATLKYMVLSLTPKGVQTMTDRDEILDYCLDNLPDDDFDQIVKECDKIAGSTSLDEEKKTTSQPATPGS